MYRLNNFNRLKNKIERKMFIKDNKDRELSIKQINFFLFLHGGIF